MTRNIVRVLSPLLFLFAAISTHAQSCGIPSVGSYTQSNTDQNCPSQLGYPVLSNFSIGRTWFTCEDTNNGYTAYAGTPEPSAVTGYGQTRFNPYCSGVPFACYAAEYAIATHAGTPTDYNRFYNYAFDVIYQGGLSSSCPQNGLWRQDFYQCQGLACQPGKCEPYGPPPTCGCEGRYGGCGTPEWNSNTCSWECFGGTPILVDVSGGGFQLTSAAGGVSYDISGNGSPIQLGWTAPGAQNAFLCLPDAYGNCNSGKQLFGNFTPQPASSTPNGFAALAVYDGNHDGVIDAHDAIFSSLRLWIDANHDGISQPNELFTLPALGITSISLNYKSDRRTDQYGNIFRYRAQVGSTDGAGRMAYDVFLITTIQPTSTATKKPSVCPPRPLIPLKGEKSLLR